METVSPYSVCDTTGSVTERYAYSAYGAPVFMTGAGTVQTRSTSDFETLYAGYRWDDDSPQMYYVRNRFLLPVIGTWNRRDPMGYMDWSNFIAYVQLSPTSQTDSMGLRKEKHHWFPRLGNDGKAHVKRLCGDHGIALNIDDFTTQLETNPGPHSWLHGNFYYHERARLIYSNSKNCCEMMTKMLELAAASWQALRVLYDDLGFAPQLVPYRGVADGGEQGRLLLLLAKACKDCTQKPTFSCEADFQICKSQAVDAYNQCVASGAYFCGAKYAVALQACYGGHRACAETRALTCAGEVLAEHPEVVVLVVVGVVVIVAPELCPVALPVLRTLAPAI